MTSPVRGHNENPQSDEMARKSGWPTTEVESKSRRLGMQRMHSEQANRPTAAPTPSSVHSTKDRQPYGPTRHVVSSGEHRRH